MSKTFRLFNCLRCHCQVMVCQQCDNGQRYCAGSCSQAARKISLKRANQKYQNSRKGRLCNAARQQRFRQRQKNNQKIVTDQASPEVRKHYLLGSKPITRNEPAISNNFRSSRHCHFCLVQGNGSFRLDFLKYRTTYRHKVTKKPNGIGVNCGY